ncbi:MAG: type II secretion system protein GspL [Halioglobus sp.]|nr:type II secretion system protein GspL [Halioglobus sp.]
MAIVRLVEGRLAWYPPGASAEPQWLDDAAAREHLRATLAQRQIKACFAAPGEDVLLLTLSITPDEKKHISKSLPYMLEEQVAADVDTLHFASTPLQEGEYAVAATAREKMAQWQVLLSDFPGIQRWLPEPLLLPWQPGEWCLLLEGDTVIFRVGQCKGFTAEKDLLEALVQAMLNEAAPPTAVIVYGVDQEADTNMLPTALRERLQWRHGNLSAAMLLSKTDEVNLNLLSGDFAPRLPVRQWWRQWRAVAAVLAAAFVLQLGAVYADYRSLSAQNIALRSAVQASYRSAFPSGVVVDAEKQLRRQLDALGGTGNGVGFVSLMERVGAAIVGMPGTTIASINYNDKAGEMRLNVVAADFEGVEKLRSRMNEAGLEAVTESSNTKGDRVSARLRVKERS